MVDRRVSTLLEILECNRQRRANTAASCVSTLLEILAPNYARLNQLTKGSVVSTLLEILVENYIRHQGTIQALQSAGIVSTLLEILGAYWIQEELLPQYSISFNPS